MTITVYANAVEEAKKRLDKIAKKAERYNVPFSYTVGEEHPQTVNIYDYDEVNHCQYVRDSYKVSAVDFDINCEQLVKSSGWTVRAMIEHGEEGNIVTGYCGYSVPDAWYKVPARCDHCGTNRARTITFMVEREDGAMKQVGKSCLKDYTGISPAMALLWAEVRAIDGADHGFDPDEEFTRDGIRMYDVRDILAFASADIAKRGYFKSDERLSTKGRVLDCLKNAHDAPADGYAKADAIIAWSKERAEKWKADREELDHLSKAAFEYEWRDCGAAGGYWDNIGVANEAAHDEYLRRDREIARNWDAIDDIERDCFVIIKSGYAKVKHIGRLCYLPVVYDKYLAKKAKAEERAAEKAKIASASAHLGEIGKRIQFTVKSADVLTHWETMYGTTYLNKIVDDAGNVLIWKSSSLAEIKPGMKMRGTVKEHGEYDGIKQTVVTRCSII